MQQTAEKSSSLHSQGAWWLFDVQSAAGSSNGAFACFQIKFSVPCPTTADAMDRWPVCPFVSAPLESVASRLHHTSYAAAQLQLQPQRNTVLFKDVVGLRYAELWQRRDKLTFGRNNNIRYRQRWVCGLWLLSFCPPGCCDELDGYRGPDRDPRARNSG
jgi:hypothetical protein